MCTASVPRYIPLSPQEFITELTGQGRPTTAAQDYAEAVSPIRRGMDSHLSDGVQRAPGRQPRDFTDYVKASDRTWHDGAGRPGAGRA
ncbi:hypothetical protein [Streptomyces sp. NPDC057579]|uniref:hypothetical protein n=1 Tax=unclassified Streptomyces TaxID=2593676 RepID=UPI0036C3FEAA